MADIPVNAPSDDQGQRSAILFFHSVGSHHGDSYSRTISRHRLGQDIEFFLSSGYQIVDVPTISDANHTRRLLSLTFDDGYESFHTDVVPLLEAFEIPATVYIHTNAIGTKNHLSEAQVHELIAHERVTVGNHTKSHPYLHMISDPETREDEIIGAQEEFEHRFDFSPNHFAYPFYRFDRESIQLVRASHETAVAGPPGHPLIGPDDHLSADSDRHLLPRIDGITLSTWFNGKGCTEVLDAL